MAKKQTPGSVFQSWVFKRFNFGTGWILSLAFPLLTQNSFYDNMKPTSYEVGFMSQGRNAFENHGP